MEKLPVECCKNIRYENLGDFIIFSYLCNKAKKCIIRPSLSFLAETQPRLENRLGQNALFSLISTY
jgi:hypothetical protein